MRHKKRILFGAVDIGYRIELYSKFIQKHYSEEMNPESLVIHLLSKEHYELSYTYQFHYHGRSFLYRWSRSILNFIRCLFRYDIFHFFSGETLLTRKLRRAELMIYKLLGKRVIMHFVGSDIRSLVFEAWKVKNIKHFLDGENDFPKKLPWQIKLTADAEKYADYILVSTPDLLELVPKAEYYPIMLDLDKFLEELDNAGIVKKNPDEIVILHCPSNLKYKGTVYIHDILKKIKSESGINIRLILPAEKIMATPKLYSVNRYELFKLYNEADIVVDQIATGWFGLQSIEAAAAGKQVISYIDSHLKPYLFPDCPIEIANVNTLEQVVMKCIEKIKNNNTSRNAQMEWVRKYHTIENNHDALLRAWGLK